MKLKLKSVCRGLGTVYLCLSKPAFLNQKADSFIVSVDSGSNKSLPSAAYDLTFKNAELIVIAFPLMGEGTVSVDVFLTLNDKAQKVFSKEFNWTAIKWLSRLNYKLNSDLAFACRDIDRQTYSHQIHIRPTQFVTSSDGSAWIAKGVICSPTGGALSVKVISGLGQQADNVSIISGRSINKLVGGLKRLETDFTLRIPRDGKTYCLVADGGERTRIGFLCFDPASVEFYSGVCSPHFYRASSPGRYSELRAKRQDYLAMLDSCDFDISCSLKFSIVVPLYRTPLKFLQEMVDSVVNQIYRNWELILVNSSPECVELCTALDQMTDDRIRVITLESNKGISGNTNFGIAEAKGDYVVFFDHDDTLDPFALYRYAERIQDCPDTDALYCDEDFLNEDGEYVAPHFKSDFNLDLLRVHNYITHLLCVRASFAKELMLRKEFDGAQDYDFLLRLVERTQNIYHVPEVLYHWRISDTSTAKSAGNKNYADDAGRRALQEHLDRCGLNGTAELTDSACFYHIAYALNEEPLVSIVIPNKDSVEVLRRCIDSIEEKTDYRNFEILVVENNSTEDATFEYYRTVPEQYENVRIATWDGPFNYSAINNYGVGLTSGKYLLFLNNDTEVIESCWLSSMLSFCQREDVGAVGAKLLYPDDTVQHAGVMMICCRNEGEMGGPIHVFNNLDRDDPGYMRRAVISQDLSAVTAACMMTKRSVFEELNGFNEDFEVAFNDVDFCLRVRSLDKLVVFDADALLYHYESFSRGYETGEKKIRFMREQGKLRTAWAEYYVNGDPYHGPMSTR